MFRNRIEELGWVFWLIVLSVIIGLAVLAFFAFVYPQSLAIQREAVEQSKSYNDASNIALSNYIVEYNSPNATDGQKKAIIGAMCEIVMKMNSESVSPRVKKFLSQNGGCE